MARNSDNSADHLSKRFGLFIDIYSVTARKSVSFKAFLTAFRDNFDTQLEAHTFVGHPQPYRKHKTTERSVEIGLDIPAFGTSEAGNNLSKIALLAQMLHPLGTRSNIDRHPIVLPGGDPMFRVRFLNLLVDGNQSNFSIPAKGVAKETGVRGYIDNLSYEFVLDADGGGFLTDSSGKKGFVYPKLIRLTFTFYPFESEALMWIGEEDSFSREAFPYIFPSTEGKRAAEASVHSPPPTSTGEGPTSTVDTVAAKRSMALLGTSAEAREESAKTWGHKQGKSWLTLAKETPGADDSQELDAKHAPKPVQPRRRPANIRKSEVGTVTRKGTLVIEGK